MKVRIPQSSCEFASVLCYETVVPTILITVTPSPPYPTEGRLQLLKTLQGSLTICNRMLLRQAMKTVAKSRNPKHRIRNRPLESKQ